MFACVRACCLRVCVCVSRVSVCVRVCVCEAKMSEASLSAPTYVCFALSPGFSLRNVYTLIRASVFVVMCSTEVIRGIIIMFWQSPVLMVGCLSVAILLKF